MNKLYQDVVVGGQSRPKKTKKKNSKEPILPNSHDSLKKRSDLIDDDPYILENELTHGKTRDDKEKENGKEQDNKSPEEELTILANRSNQVLFQAKSIFPFDFFPDTISIDGNKVNIHIKTFFFTETATSVILKEIMDVRVESTLFVAKLIIDYGPHPLKVHTVYIDNLRKKDALKAKEIIEGVLVVYRSENVDTTKLKPEETLEEIKEVGSLEEHEV